jgi:hypothetical protein
MLSALATATGHGGGSEGAGNGLVVHGDSFARAKWPLGKRDEPTRQFFPRAALFTPPHHKGGVRWKETGCRDVSGGMNTRHVELTPLVNAAGGAITAALVLARVACDLLLTHEAISANVWVVLLVAAPLAFVVWLYSLHVQTDGFEPFEREASHTTLWCWFVPGFNGAQPPRLVWDVWRSLGLDESPRFVYVIGAWWFLVMARFPLAALAVGGFAPWLAVASHVVSGLLTCWVVVRVTAWMVVRQLREGVMRAPACF